MNYYWRNKEWKRSDKYCSYIIDCSKNINFIRLMVLKDICIDKHTLSHANYEWYSRKKTIEEKLLRLIIKSRCNKFDFKTIKNNHTLQVDGPWRAVYSKGSICNIKSTGDHSLSTTEMVNSSYNSQLKQHIDI